MKENKIDKYLNYTRQLLKHHKLNNYDVIINSRLKTTYAYCKYNKQIELNKFYLENGENEDIIDTIIHEVSHALSHKLYGEKGKGHNKLWKDLFIKLGGSGDRCRSIKKAYSSTSLEKYKNFTKRKKKIAYHIMECPHCKKTIRQKTKRIYACSDCCEKYNNGKYNEKYEFKIIKTIINENL